MMNIKRGTVNSALHGIKVGTDSQEVLRHLEVPFTVRRVYWLSGPSGPRGSHAHKELQQVMICTAGSVSLTLVYGDHEETRRLRQHEAAYVGPGVWRDIAPLAEGDQLMVLASLPYSEEDYIRDYAEYLEWVKDA